ncbi:MAG: 3',5'-cyclic-nucleotide phosphodiesterase [Deltaproteobacteria bacterium]|nr:3',5'-cyclic-nucleotide phosphodiesterase [Deltaproteobacteria bacterium]
MEIRVLGCHGSQLPGYGFTGFLIDTGMLLDAGTVTSVLTLEEQARIGHILITHAHLDHIREIASLADNVCQLHRDFPIEVVSTPHVIEMLRAHIFNDAIWPDFSRIPSVERPVIRFVAIQAGEKMRLGHLNVTAIPVHHSVETVAYVIETDEAAPPASAVFVGDTGPTEEIWQVVRQQCGNVGAIFVETSLPEEMTGIAELTGHLTPAGLASELKKLGSLQPPIYLYHMKIQYCREIQREIALMGNHRIRVLKDGQVIQI